MKWLVDLCEALRLRIAEQGRSQLQWYQFKIGQWNWHQKSYPVE
jgi:hypothetical protein